MLIAGYLAIVVAAALGPGEQGADTGAKPVEVQLDAPDGCAGPDAFYESLRSRTDRVRRAAGREARTTLQVRLTPGHRQVVGELRMIDDRGGTDTRKVQGATCDEVVQALSLTAALALDPAALLSAPLSPGPSGATDSAASGGSPAGATAAASPGAVAQPAGARPEQRDEETAAEAKTEPEPERPPRPVPTAELSVGVLAAAVLTTTLKDTPSAGVAIAARRTLRGSGVFRPSLGLAVAYARNDLVSSPELAKVGFASLAGSVCPVRLSASILTIQPCALVIGGWLWATGLGMTRADTADRAWLSAGASLRASAWLGSGFALELEAGVTAPLVKRRFYATETRNVVAETPALAPIVGLGLTYGL